MQEADPNRDMTGVLSPAFRKDINDPVIWRRLLDEQVGLHLLWRDHTNGTWHAHATFPWLPDDFLPYWAPEYDSRAGLSGTGPTAAAAALALFDHPRIVCAPVSSGVVLATAKLACALATLAETYRGRVCSWCQGDRAPGELCACNT